MDKDKKGVNLAFVKKLISKCKYRDRGGKNPAYPKLLRCYGVVELLRCINKSKIPPL